MERIAAVLLLVLLAGCAAFDLPTFSAPAKICILGNGGMSDLIGCAYLEPTLTELETPEMTRAICAAGAETRACKK